MTPKQEYHEALFAYGWALTQLLSRSSPGDRETAEAALDHLKALWPGEGAAPERVAALEVTEEMVERARVKIQEIIEMDFYRIPQTVVRRVLEAALDAAPRDRVGEVV